MTEPLLRTELLVKRYGGLLATDNVSIDVRPGEIHALIGPNGAGKTTLVHQLTGIVAPDSAERAASPTPLLTETTNTNALGRILYTDYVYLFQTSGLILLVAMIGAIVLTLRSRGGVKRQRISAQVSRSREDSVEIKHIEPGSGV